jgi:hypothetical protein
LGGYGEALLMSKAVKQTRPKPFTGILAQPFDKPGDLEIAIRTYGEPESVKKAIYEAVNEHINQQRLERLIALAAHYGVDLQSRKPDLVLDLLFRIAADFVPGFRSNNDPRNTRSIGRPRGMLSGENFELFKSIEKIVHRKGVTAHNACAIISKDRKSHWHGKGVPALYERYKRFKAEFEFRQKEWRENPHPLNARITEIKKGGSGATPLTKIPN